MSEIGAMFEKWYPKFMESNVIDLQPETNAEMTQLTGSIAYCHEMWGILLFVDTVQEKRFMIMSLYVSYKIKSKYVISLKNGFRLLLML